MSKPQVAVVILNWNGKVFLEKFLPDVIKHSSKEADVYIADNASTDDSVAFLEKNFPDIKIIKMESNTGYAGGYNNALKEITADYYILLNSDILVTENWISPVVELMESDKSIAACQPKILDYYKRDYFEYAGAGGGFIDFLGYPFCRGRIMNTLEKDNGQYDDITEIFWATGACMFIKAENFFEVKGFDEDFFAHMEEIDLCWRLKRSRKKIMYCGKSAVYHVGGGTLPKNNPRKTYFNFRNNLFLLSKNLKHRQLLFVLLLRACLDRLAAISFFLKGNYKDWFAVYKAWAVFKLNFLKMRKKAKLIEKRKVNCIYKGSIVFDKMVLGKKEFKNLRFNKKD